MHEFYESLMPPAGMRFLVCCCLVKSHYKGITHFLLLSLSLLLLSFCFKDSVNTINVTPKSLPQSTVYSV